MEGRSDSNRGYAVLAVGRAVSALSPKLRTQRTKSATSPVRLGRLPTPSRDRIRSGPNMKKLSLLLCFLPLAHAAHVTILRDEYGVPHIFAQDAAGAAFG